MQIDEAIVRVRRIESSMREAARRCAKRNDREPASLVVYQDAEAMRTVLNEIEYLRFELEDAKMRRGSQTNVVDFLADSGGDERNDTR